MSQPEVKYMLQDRKEQDGLKRVNCFYCKVSDVEKNMTTKQLIRKDRTPGDKLLICRKCAGIINKKEA